MKRAMFTVFNIQMVLLTFCCIWRD